LSWIETAKRAAVRRALEEIRDANVVGIGSGTTIELLVSELALTAKRKALELKLIPTSSQIEAAIVMAGLKAVNPNEVSQIDLAIDGADQVALRTLDLIKGRGAALTREKIIHAAADRLIIVVDERKLTKTLGANQPVPVEVIPFARRFVLSRITKLGGKPSLRYSNEGGPVVTDNGNFVVDVDFGQIENAALLDDRLRSIPGIVETGLFLGMTDRVYVGLKDGHVQILEPE